MRLRQTAALTAATALAVLIPTADAHAAAISCGGSVSTQGITANGCISAEKFKEGKVFFRDIKAHTVITNTRAQASYVEYEAFLHVAGDGDDWTKMGSVRTLVQRHSTVGPIEIASSSRVCFVVNAKITVRVHVRPAAGAWSNWSSATTSQCQT